MRQFAVDFSLVVLSVRCAYLVDAIILKEPLQDFDTVLQRLRDKVSRTAPNSVTFHIGMRSRLNSHLL
ncbi:hypothetical protein SERLADRAFT_370650 [Serpula lacrymans var. lacrymans S7.9]|uniref:Uncharacterized protein n=1 Tax=Serpula lacrymans var. lacrymans (strain S7.9) TaxID=578457 RepID=F8NYX8_SERL9|nr:uncharacterized protein SERLADRAFT_370650 [Serpula lacrymans var. lacrymans S7.9]EGO23799.1 hypothetical protein SERLADRAFT_370650 [Serpula lacrymans var. lacrymans S7.9]